jgi:purine nucleosidase
VAEPFLVDCDTGIDDALAILYLLADPNADLVAITTTAGNCSAAQAAHNTLSLLTLAGRSDIPVAIGASRPLARPFDGGAPQVHGANGVGDIQLPPPAAAPSQQSAVELIVNTARAHGGGLHLITIAPLTTLALALRAEPALPTLIKSVTVMGGAAMVPGNVSAVTEANIGNDPEAAAEVFAAGWPITLVPLDVTMDNVLTEPDRQRLLDSDRPIARTMGAMLKTYFDFYRDIYGRPCCALHDPLAAAIATGSVQPASAPTVAVVVDDSGGPGRGQTICDLRGRFRGYPVDAPGGCRVVLSMAQPFAPTLMERLLAL